MGPCNNPTVNNNTTSGRFFFPYLSHESYSRAQLQGIVQVINYLVPMVQITVTVKQSWDGLFSLPFQLRGSS
ncbi:MAG: hypothetical protein ACOYLO_12940 [Ferruginibacter sp.]